MAWWAWFLVGMATMLVIYTAILMVMAKVAARKMGIDPMMTVKAVKMMRDYRKE